MTTRAIRRNEERQAANAAARERASVVRETPPRRARQITQLQLLMSRSSITIPQGHAGERLYRDWRAAGREPCVVANLAPVSRQRGGLRVQEYQEDAERRLTAALRAVGAILSPVLVHVCLLDLPAGDWAKQNGRPETDGHAALRLALDALVGHYAASL